MINDTLLKNLNSLSRVGPITGKFLQKLLGGNRIFDLVLHRPIRIESILLSPRIFEAPNQSLVILKAKVESHIKPTTNRQPYRVICYNPTGYITLVFFKIFPSQIAKMSIDSEIAILGNLQKLNGENQIVHPQEILPASQINQLPKANIIYPLGAAISQKFLSQKIHDVLTKLDEINEEWIDKNFLKTQSWSSFVASLKNLHNPKNENDFLPTNPNRKRLAYDELLAWQIAVLLAKNKNNAKKKFIAPTKNIADKFLESLPFELTKSQLEAVKEISAEINSSKKMLRLLQGDVGSGKTIVAIISCLHSLSQNKQACIIAPTTVLAKQHLAYFRRLLEKEKINVEILTSAVTKKQKAKICDDLSTGKIDILISTHAVLEDDIKFKNLGLAIIDEQHRFGVMQRLKLVEKGCDVDTLLMSATPIPRSLMMSLYSDMDISVLSEKPKNRQAIETLILSAKKIDQVTQSIKRAISQGEKIYWICPLIEIGEASEKNFFIPLKQEISVQVATSITAKTLPHINETDSEKNNKKDEINLANVRQKHAELVKIFGAEKVALLHGKMKENEKEKIMTEFANRNSDLKILVSTTVIEVGIDVPDATVILIENAENFGLSQLHQLRGRVGRSEKKSFCILLYGEKFGAVAKERLNILRSSNDGFFIAEEDLRMRGSGELIGTKQSGFPEFRIADLNFDSDLLKIAHKNALLILNKDQNLQNPSSQKYQYLLKLFGYDDCLKIIVAG